MASSITTYQNCASHQTQATESGSGQCMNIKHYVFKQGLARPVEVDYRQDVLWGATQLVLI